MIQSLIQTDILICNTKLDTNVQSLIQTNPTEICYKARYKQTYNKPNIYEYLKIDFHELPCK